MTYLSFLFQVLFIKLKVLSLYLFCLNSKIIIIIIFSNSLEYEIDNKL